MFWSFISDKQKKYTDMCALIDPDTMSLQCDPDLVKEVTEGFLLKLFKWSVVHSTEEPSPNRILDQVNLVSNDSLESGRLQEVSCLV